MFTIHDVLLKRILLFVPATAVLGILTANLFVYPVFTRILLQHAQSDAVTIARHMSTMLFPENVLSDEAYFEQAGTMIRKTADEFSLYKLKVFSARGRVVYSTDAGEIGEVNNLEYFHDDVAGGRVTHKIVRKNTRTLEGRTLEVDVVETYVPVVKNGRFVGALEVYFDISGSIRGIRNALALCNMISVGLLLIFCVTCFLVIRRLDTVLLEKQEARVQLEKANVRMTREIDQRIRLEKEREVLIGELRESLDKIKVLKGLVPICSFCKNIRNDAGYWEQMEAYIEKYSEVEFSHGLCPECARKHYPDLNLEGGEESAAGKR